LTIIWMFFIQNILVIEIGADYKREPRNGTKQCNTSHDLSVLTDIIVSFLLFDNL